MFSRIVVPNSTDSWGKKAMRRRSDARVTSVTS
jgi:hypothetical protein